MKQKTKNTTVAVSPELYHPTRQLAAVYHAPVAYLLQRMPTALKAVRFSKPGPQTAAATQPTPSKKDAALFCCTAAKPDLNHSLSATCKDRIAVRTVKVRQYDDDNLHILNHLSKRPKPRSDTVRQGVKRSVVGTAHEFPGCIISSSGINLPPQLSRNSQGFTFK